MILKMSRNAAHRMLKKKYTTKSVVHDIISNISKINQTNKKRNFSTITNDCSYNVIRICCLGCCYRPVVMVTIMATNHHCYNLSMLSLANIIPAFPP